jgi:hypothetical protein
MLIGAGISGAERADILDRRGVVAEDAAAGAAWEVIAESLAGAPRCAERESFWRERALLAALGVLDAALARDVPFLAGMRSAGFPEPLRSLPALLRASGTLPHVIRAVG